MSKQISKKPINQENSGGDLVAKFLMQIFKINHLKLLNTATQEKSVEDFIDEIISDLGINLEVSDDDYSRIPKTGSLIIISNHPLGVLDELLLLKTLYHQREDVKIITNSAIQDFNILRKNYISVKSDNFLSILNNDATRMHEISEHLSKQGAILIFPSGNQPLYQIKGNEIVDSEWHLPILKYISIANSPVLPIYIKSSSSWGLNLYRQFHPFLQTNILNSELHDSRNKTIQLRIGNPITRKDIKSYENIQQLGRFLRAKVYTLGTTLKVRKFFNLEQISKPTKQKTIIDAVENSKLICEIEAIREEFALFNFQNFTVFCTPTVKIPNLMLEIGRLREITFREVGEGTNNTIDVDEYDLYYNQLIVWDEETKQVVGAYRVGKGKDIMAQYGKKGFYITSLFKINKHFCPILNDSIELGRSFVIKEYQRKPLSLFLLWKGIVYFLIKNPEYRYLIGPASISNDFSKFSKSLIVDFIKKNYFHAEFAKLIKPKKAFKVKFKNLESEKEAIIESSKDSFKLLDKYIKDIDNELTTPVLIKKYISLNAKIAAFNLDPKFNNSLDGLIILDLFDIPLDILKSLCKEVNDEAIFERFVATNQNKFEDLKAN